MKVQSDRNFLQLKVGQVDRGKTDAWNIYVMEVTPDNFFKPDTHDGILKELYARSQFELSHVKETSLYSVATAQAIGGSQGFVHCSRNKKCDTKRWSCLKSGLLCNSKCHCNTCCCNK